MEKSDQLVDRLSESECGRRNTRREKTDDFTIKSIIEKFIENEWRIIFYSKLMSFCQ